MLWGLFQSGGFSRRCGRTQNLVCSCPRILAMFMFEEPKPYQGDGIWMRTRGLQKFSARTNEWYPLAAVPGKFTLCSSLTEMSVWSLSSLWSIGFPGAWMPGDFHDCRNVGIEPAGLANGRLN